jgi:hypothetical protein
MKIRRVTRLDVPARGALELKLGGAGRAGRAAAGGLAATAALAWMAWAPLPPGPRERVVVIPEGTAIWRTAGHHAEPLPSHIRLILAVQDVLVVRNDDKTEVGVGPILLAPGRVLGAPGRAREHRGRGAARGGIEPPWLAPRAAAGRPRVDGGAFSAPPRSV